MGKKSKESLKTENKPYRFQPGNTFGKGRPKKGECLTEILRDLALDKIKYKNGKKEEIMERRKALALRMWDDALYGGKDYNTIRTYLYDRIDGKPTQPIEGEIDLFSYLASLSVEELENERRKLSS